MVFCFRRCSSPADDPKRLPRSFGQGGPSKDREPLKPIRSTETENGQQKGNLELK